MGRPIRHNYRILGEKFCPLYEGGMSTHAIAAAEGVNQPAVRKALETVGCPLRTKTDALKIIGYGRVATDEQIASALKIERGNQAKAAVRLRISGVAIHKRLKKSPMLRAALLAAKTGAGEHDAT